MKRIAQTRSFTSLIDSDCIYIDKTKEISSLLMHERVFISRPRRFGKSLLLDTIGTLFEYGTEPYFHGTWIYDKWKEKKYPVLRISFLRFSCTDYGNFCRDFDRCIAGFARLHGIDYVSQDRPASSMSELFDLLEINKVKIVILIDEYDAQLAANINNPELYECFRTAIREFYSVIKDELLIKFIGITGVTRLKDVSVFSVGSDIHDASYDADVATITGFTGEEIRKYYADYIDLAVSLEKGIAEENVTEEQRGELIDRLAENYNGYCFDETNKAKVFSTWSVSSFFFDLYRKRFVCFGEYWYENGGRPTILLNYLKSHTFDISSYTGCIYADSDDFLNPSSLLNMDQTVLMCQTGYLTLNSRLDSFSSFKVCLKIPNNEVRRALAQVFSSSVFSSYIRDNPDYRSIFCKADASTVVSELNGLFNSISYEKYPVNNEKAVQSYMHVFMMGGNLPVRTEVQSAAGRADIVLEYDSRRLVLELKYAETDAECEKKLHEAIEQIKDRKYGSTLPEKPVMKLALVFNGDSSVRQFTHWAEVK